ncbi:MAG: hypothetical protein F6K48_03185 [Okeania sp. SIO3H1]|nr:hypothetical protein [Okeania sp. SIO3H1]
MIGSLGFFNPLNKTLFTIPGVKVDVTVGRALLGVGALVAAKFLLKH